MSHITLLGKEEAPERAEPVLKEIEAKNGDVPISFRVLAANPRLLKAQWSHHQAVMKPTDKVPRKMKEAIALTVSVHNRSRYSIETHSKALREVVGASKEEVEKIMDGTVTEEPLGPVLDFVRTVTVDATDVTRDQVAGLRKLGFNEAELLEIVAVAAHLNGFNRLLDALGVETGP
ncbi:MAG: carboxymuconolactone decarboxylase family protein [Euryarchaeota archaeon]|nr:carboxymuconolactone decarboxylase family protein [Euryarchaeota archaeon]